MLKKYCIAALALFSLGSGVSSAAVVNFQFTGAVTYGGSLAAVGSQITGMFSYDAATLSSSSYGGFSGYTFPAPFGISANVGGHAVAANNLGISIWNNFGGNVEDMVDVAGGPVTVDGNSYADGSFGFRLASKPGSTNVLNSTALPSFFDVAAFDAGSTLNYGWLQSDGGPNGQLLQFSVNSIVSSVPVPATLWLLGSGLLGLIGVARRKAV
jgi:hypothetical protein